MQKQDSVTSFFDLLSNSGALLGQSEQWLKQAIKSKPTDISLLHRMSSVYRQQGKLEQALACCKEVLHIEPNHPSCHYLKSLLTHQDLIHYSRIGERPVPFVQKFNFLTSVEQQVIWQLLEDRKEQFLPAKVANTIQVQTDVRLSSVLYKNQLKSISTPFIERVKKYLTPSLPKLAMEPFKVERTELQLTRHTHNDFFHVHRDSSLKQADKPQNSQVTRQVTFVYYFYQQPKQFQGGDLLLFDTDATANTYHPIYTRIAPINNSIIFFPSHCYHQVTAVTLDSADFQSGRFTLNGWLHR